MAVLSALLVAAAVVGAAASVRLHGASREALRELRDGERRLETGPERGLGDELRWYAEVSAATRGWRAAAALTAVLSALGLVVGSWTLTTPLSALDRAGTICVLVALLLVAGAAVLEGVRAQRRVLDAAHRSVLWPVRRLEDALVATAAATARARRAHRAWLRTAAADHPGAGALARLRRRTYDRAEAERVRAVDTLRRAAPVTVRGARPPAGYPDGLRGLTALLTPRPDSPAPRPDTIPARTPGATAAAPRPDTPAAGSERALPGLLDDEAWAAAVADLSRAADLDLDRRTRWLAAAAACAELRDDPPARESAARWALDAAARPAGPTTDLLPNVVAVEPLRPDTWANALRRARLTGAPAALLAALTLRWAYALLPGPLDPALSAAVEIMGELPSAEDYLREVRPGFEALGATGPQLSRLVPQWTAPGTPVSP